MRSLTLTPARERASALTSVILSCGRLDFLAFLAFSLSLRPGLTYLARAEVVEQHLQLGVGLKWALPGPGARSSR